MTGILYSLRVDTPVFWRSALLVGAVGSAAWAFAAGQPGELLRADPELARLMRGMALIKGCLMIAALSAVAWRLQWPVTRRLAMGYLVGVWLGVAAAVLIWQLAFIAWAAITFHIGEGLLLVLAWRDRGVLTTRRAIATRRVSGLDHAAAISAIGSTAG